MPLVVPVLRLFMLFFNVFETYKTMKPARSSRRGGRAAVRALTNRKRDMKGCLAVWIVWCCFAVYERTFETFLSLLVPFYSEIKSIVLLFFIVTRARGAEPIYLHVIRPMIKPYASTVDSLLDLARMFGDVAFIVITVPIQYSLAWWHGTPMDIEEIQIEEIQDIQPIEDIRSESPVAYHPRSLESERPTAQPANVEQLEALAFVPHIAPPAQAFPEPATFEHTSIPATPEPATAPILLAEIVVEEPRPITYVNHVNETASEDVSRPPDKWSSQVTLTAEAPLRTISSTSQTSSGGAPSIASSASVNTSLPPRVPPKDGSKRRTRRNGDPKVPTSPPKPHEPQLYRYQSKPAPKAVPTQSAHEIWLPPASTHDASEGEAPPAASQPILEHSRVNTSRSGVESETAETLTVDEWRLYNPFPSAYPPTPLPAAPAKLVLAPSNSARRPLDQTRSKSDGRIPSSSRTLAAHPEGSEANGSGNMSAGASTTGTTGGGGDDSSDGEGMDVDSGDDSEDDFNVTLQTPRSQRNGTLPMRQLVSMASDSSMASSSTKLSTANRGSTLWTDNSSESDSDSCSDESPAVGHKRSSTAQGGRDSQSTVRASSRQVAQAIHLPRQASTTSTSESLDEDKTPFDNSSDTKRRRVTPLPVQKPASALPRLIVNDATVRARGRGRGQAPTRTSSRIAHSSSQAPDMASMHSNSSQTTIGGGRGRGAPITRERTVRGRT